MAVKLAELINALVKIQTVIGDTDVQIVTDDTRFLPITGVTWDRYEEDGDRIAEIETGPELPDD